MMTLGVKTNERINVDFEEGEMVNVIEGVWAGTAGEIKRIDETRQTVTINVDMFGRDVYKRQSLQCIKMYQNG